MNDSRRARTAPAGAHRLAYAAVALAGGVAFAPSPAPAQGVDCKVGVDCCYIAASGHNPPRYSMAWDQTLGSGLAVLARSGFSRRVIGPVSGTKCMLYWNAEIAPLPGYSPWRVGAASAMTDGSAGPPPAPDGGAAHSPDAIPTVPAVPRLPGEDVAATEPAAPGPAPRGGHWRFVGAVPAKAPPNAQPSDIVSYSNEIGAGGMSMSLTTDSHKGDGPATWAGSATWTLGARDGLHSLVPGSRVDATLTVSDRSVPEQKSGWRHGYTGMSCAVRFDDPGAGVGVTDAGAVDLVAVAVGEQKQEKATGQATVPAGPGRWKGRMALEVACSGIGKYRRVYAWDDGSGTARTATPEADPRAGGVAGAGGSADGAPPPRPGGATVGGRPAGVAAVPPTTGTPVLPPEDEAPEEAPPAPAARSDGPPRRTPDHGGGSPSGYGGPSVAERPGASQPMPPPADASGASPPSLLFDNWNPNACALTGTARFALDRPARLTGIDLWVQWRTGETLLPFELRRDGRVVARGSLERGACDPNDASWCFARAALSLQTAVGLYETVVPSGRVCANPASGGNGFVRITGRRS